VLLHYALQGLFHAALRVRRPYWRLFNNLVLYAPDALVPVYPHVDDDLVDLPHDLAAQHGLQNDPLADYETAVVAARLGTDLSSARPLTLRPAVPASTVAITRSAAPPQPVLDAARLLAAAPNDNPVAHSDAQRTAREILRVLDASPIRDPAKAVRRTRNRYTQTYFQLLF
jgi:hypothetical protein